jgi:predicted ATPase
MFTKVSIKNFKSIKDLEFAPKRVNVFIGEPNAGKSNIIEALGVFSEGSMKFQDFFRFRTIGDLFFDRDLASEINISVEDEEYRREWTLRFSNGEYLCRLSPAPTNRDDFKLIGPKEFKVSYDGSIKEHKKTSSDHGDKVLHPCRLYTFRSSPKQDPAETGYLTCPFGSNLSNLLASDARLRSLVRDLFKDKGLRLSVDSEQGGISLTKDVNGQLYHFGYQTVSETLRRIVFYMAALETNQNALLLLDEPEANTFPFYTNYLAERIALDETNQFFLTTHNPYILGSIVAKAPVKDLAVFVTEMVDYQTVLKPVTPGGLSKILEYGPDAFLNLSHLIEE